MAVVVRVSLDLEANGRARSVPRAETIDSLVNRLAIVILANLVSSKTVVLNIVDPLGPEDGANNIPSLEPETAPAESLPNKHG